MFKFYLYKIGQYIVNLLPLSLSYRFAMFVSDLQCTFSFRDHRAVRNNLRTILNTDKNLEPLVREVFRNFGKYLVDFFRMDKNMNMQFIQENVKVENLDYIKKALERGKGAIIITAHIGNWELGAVAVSVLGYPLMAVALPHKERPVNDLFNHQREVKGITVVPSNVAVRKCIDTLRNNKLVALVADRDFTLHGEVLDFLGRKAFIPKGAALFSIKTGAPIVPCFMTRNPDDTFVLSLEQPIVPPLEIKETIAQDALIKVMRQYTDVIENKIRQFPTQWLMFREFWAA